MEQKKEFKRPTWNEYFLEIAEVTAKRSNCIKRKVGAVLTKDHRIISCGYNGTARRTTDCFNGGCPRCNNPRIKSGNKLDQCICIHAEKNAILFANAGNLEGTIMYCTHQPCLDCLKHIVQVGIGVIYYSEPYTIPKELEEAYKILESKVEMIDPNHPCIIN